MKITEFDWLDHILDKIEAKHGVSSEEVEEAASVAPHVRRGRHGLYLLYGVTESGRYLLVVLKDLGRGVVRPITARDLDRDEQRLYRGAVGRRNAG